MKDVELDALGAWSPDGESFLYRAKDELRVVSLSTGTVAGVAQNVSPFTTEALWKLIDRVGVWSPDGSRIAYVRTSSSDGLQELHTVRPDGSDDRLIASNAFLCERVWSADGGWIGYVEKDAPLPATTEGHVATARADGTAKVIVQRWRAPTGFAPGLP